MYWVTLGLSGLVLCTMLNDKYKYRYWRWLVYRQKLGWVSVPIFQATLLGSYMTVMGSIVLLFS